ncbi:hypothetical protein ACM6L3_17955 [Paenibacillus larvae]
MAKRFELSKEMYGRVVSNIPLVTTSISTLKTMERKEAVTST